MGFFHINEISLSSLCLNELYLNFAGFIESRVVYNSVHTFKKIYPQQILKRKFCSIEGLFALKPFLSASVD